MKTHDSTSRGRLLHVVTLECRDGEHAKRCLDALAAHGRPDALAFDCASYEFGVRQGAEDTVVLVERWTRWEDLDALLSAKVIPALPVYNALLKRPFDPAKDTMRIEVDAG